VRRDRLRDLEHHVVSSSTEPTESTGGASCTAFIARPANFVTITTRRSRALADSFGAPPPLLRSRSARAFASATKRRARCSSRGSAIARRRLCWLSATCRATAPASEH
jgi:hypothetical protein